MTTLELTEHPDLAALAAELSQGHAVVITDHGQPMGEVVPTRSQREPWLTRLQSLHASFTSPAYLGNSVVDMRQKSR